MLSGSVGASPNFVTCLGIVARCGLIMSQGEIYERAPMLTNLFAASRRLQFLCGNRSASLLHYWWRTAGFIYALHRNNHSM